MKKILLLLTCLLCVSCNNNNRLSVRMSNVYWGIDEHMGYLLIYVGHNNKNDFAKRCDISSTLLTLLFNGKRSISKEVAKAFTKNGFKVEIGE